MPRDPKKVADTMRRGRARRVENLLGVKIAAKAEKVNLRLKTDMRGKGAESTKVLELLANLRVKETRVARESQAAKDSRGMAESQAVKLSRKKEKRLPASRENLKA